MLKNGKNNALGCTFLIFVLSQSLVGCRISATEPEAAVAARISDDDSSSIRLGVSGGTTAISSQVITGAYFWDDTGTSVAGTMVDHGSIDLATTSPSTAGYYSEFTNGTPAQSNICTGNQILGITGSATCVTGTSDAVTTNVLVGRTFWNGAGATSTGTMTNHGAITIDDANDTLAAGYVSSLVVSAGSLLAANICSGNTILGVSGSASCPSLPTSTLSYGSFDWGSISGPSTKTITITTTGSTSGAINFHFTGTGTAGFGITAINGLTTSQNCSAGDATVSVNGSTLTSASISFVPVYVDGSAKSMTITASDLAGNSWAIPVSATYSNPILGGTGLLTWLKADAITGLANGDPVAAWDDSSSNNNDATQGNANKRPTYVTNVMNGNPVLRFDGSDDYLDTSVVPATGAGARTLIAVVKYTTVNADYGHILHYGDTAGTEQTYGLLNAVNTQAKFGNHYWGSRYTSTISSAVAGSYIVIGQYSGTADTIYVNGTSGGSTTIALSTASTVPLTIGNAVTGTNLIYTGDIAEVAAYSSNLTTSAREAIECSLASKYAITIGHACP